MNFFAPGFPPASTSRRLRRAAYPGAGAGRSRRIAAGLTGVALTLSCGGDTAAPTPGPPPPPPPPAQPTTLSIAPDSVRLTALDATAQLSADLRDQNGRQMTGVTIDWAATDTLVATVTASGLVRSTGPGAATVTATAGGLSATASVLVEQVVADVIVTPPAPTVFQGDTLRLAAEARDANEHRVPEVAFVWISDDESVATVDSTGLVHAGTRGTATITARIGEVSGATRLTVTRRSIPPNPDVDVGTSHSLQGAGMSVSHAEVRFGRGEFFAAMAYGDFDDDGDTDIFYSPGDGSRNALPPELYANDGTGRFSLAPGFFGPEIAGAVHGRKALPGDFNGDGRIDVFVLGHGYDHPPFPGEAPYVLLSTENGFVLGTGLEHIIGFHHGGASADIDADGDLDVFVTENFRGPFFLINDGTGFFRQDRTRLEGIGQFEGNFTAEFVDVDGDQYVDLLVAGHEYEGFRTQILWGDESGVFSTAGATLIPEVPGYGIVVDIDVGDLDGDGARDLVINRTGDPSGAGWYRGYHLQVLRQTGTRGFSDVTRERLRQHEDPEARWFLWIRIWDVDDDGDPDLVVDDETDRNLFWTNDGTGGFGRGGLIPRNFSVDEGSSHSLQNPPFPIEHRRMRTGRPGWVVAMAYGDFSGDGHADIFYAPQDGSSGSLPAELYVGDGSGAFARDAGFAGGSPPSRRNARKVLPGDYNRDGRIDVLVLGPDDAPYTLLSTGSGYVRGETLEEYVGASQYAGAAADLDADGDLDVFLAGPPVLLINDGAGRFRRSFRPVKLDGFVLASELVDVDADGYVDLLVGGHEQDGGLTQILWGDSTGVFDSANGTVLQAVPGYGVVLDIDAADTDGDGDRDLLILRTGDGTSRGFYDGYYVQLLEQARDRRFTDATAESITGNEDGAAPSVRWLRIYDVDDDGDPDIVVDDYSTYGLILRNDGAGRFQR